MAFLNFSKIVLKSIYSYNFKTIFLTVLPKVIGHSKSLWRSSYTSERSMVLVKSQTFLLFPQIDKSVLKCWSLGGCQESRLLKIPETASLNFLLNIPTWSDFAIGLVLLLTSLVFLSGCLILIVAILKSTLQGIR